MSIHRSLKAKGKLKRHRNVLTRTERVEELKRKERWKDGDSVFGLQKVRVYRARRRTKAAKEEPETEAAAGEAAAGDTAAPAPEVPQAPAE